MEHKDRSCYHKEYGVTLVEYTLIAAILIVVAIAYSGSLAPTAQNFYENETSGLSIAYPTGFTNQ